MQDIDKHKARLLAELQQVKRAGWEKENLTTVLRAIRQEAEILGLMAKDTTQTGVRVIVEVVDDWKTPAVAPWSGHGENGG